MMLSKDGTSIIGKIGILLPLLIVFIAADAAACPDHRSGAALRTKAVKIRNGGSMQTTVISYRAPATYRLCGNTLRDTRGVAYVRDGRRSYNNDARYVAARYGTTRAKYVAVRNVDRSPRYVAVRRAAPVYIEDTGVSYVAVRNASPYYDRGHTRTIVRGIDIGPDPHYSSIRSAPVYVENGNRKYVSVRDMERYSRVAVRDVDIDNEPRYVIKEDVDGYDDRVAATYVSVRDRSEFPTEIEEVELGDEPIERSNSVRYSDVAFSDDDAAFLSTNGLEDACMYPTRATNVAQPRMVSYMDDEEIDDDAFLRVRSAAPAVVSYKPVNYYDPVDEDDMEYVRQVSYIPESSLVEAEIETADCPMEVSNVVGETTDVSYASTEPIAVGTTGFDADYYETSRIARDYGLRDGFEDGEDAGMERDAYHPENSGDYQKATNGYEDSFGDKDVYRASYRSAYLSGYRAGFDSIARSRAVG